MKKTRRLLLFALALLGISPALAAPPLKVYILAGQSNMDGQAKTRTIDAMRDDPEVAELYQKMTDKDGNPITVEGVHIVHNQRSGKLDATFGSALRGPKIGPEYAFGIYMKESIEEPILLIKTAWGGKDLIQQFRPPSGGDFEKKTDKHGNKTGHFYRRMIKEVKDVLADPGKYHPDYNEEAGYEIAGFVWFQGFNDQFGPYPNSDPENKKSVKDFSEYGRLLACLIRDVRKELSAPEMKVVIGAVGIEGVVATEHQGIPRRGGTWVALQRAQAAPAGMPEFEGNVSVVYTGKQWDHKLAAAALKLKWVNKKVGLRIKDGTVERGTPEEDEMRASYIKEKGVTQEEQKMAAGISDGEYHYLGSAKIYSRIGKAFAESMINMENQED